jgi:hypothetical protein
VRGRGRRRKDKGKIEYKRAKYMLKKIREVFHERRKCIIFLHCPKSSADFREITRSVYGSKSPGG